ncbi:M18 family aminopeptidase [Inconstantimicrobium mannanitabidum]|uniref:M18 family aminopeptidase 2 n=1 Tax=Inconstantimicrobium mannanitabidum TaxID=1604901 RepID=A0ACB5RFJ3_9CLOT|nr:M18 family aminopeptidase [Clostridium sp. TW13]GKX67850.1 putative M18 family aminopeptidase 2 [Clostridium sp. TW13]
MEKKLALELIDFIYDSPTAFHAVKSVKSLIEKEGFRELKSDERWNLEQEGKYYVTTNDSAIVAFVVGKELPQQAGFKLIGAHTDAPTFRIKPKPEMVAEGKYLKLNTEVYPSPILTTWFDRPLSIAGRVTLRSDDILNPRTELLNVKRPIMIIPNLAIHMNRDVNNGVKINRQEDTLPLVGLINDNLEKENFLINLIAKELKVNKEDVLDFDLYLYEFEKGSVIGVNEEFISSSRIDDLEMVHAGIKALISSKVNKATNVMVCFDNEEVGSSTKQGANSEFLAQLLERIVLVLGGDREDYFRALKKSFIISADVAHAVHPNAGSKHDPVLRPMINAGPVIKIAASQSYTSDADSSAVYEEICRKAGVPCQKFANRSDSAGGSTIGPISARHLHIRSVDVGTALLAMHSVRELCGVSDHYYTTKSFEEYFNL